MQRLHIDIVGPLLQTKRGSRFILTLQCSFTKWAEAYAIPNQRASTRAKVLVKNWTCRFGVLDSMHSDQGRNFEPTVFQETCMLLGIDKTRSTAYHPEGNGQVENLHWTMKSMLTASAEEQPGSWDEQLDFCMMAYQSSVYASTGHSPFELIFGHEMQIPLDVMMGNAKETGSTYTKFVVDLRERLIQAHQDVREKLKVAQRCQNCYFYLLMYFLIPISSSCNFDKPFSLKVVVKCLALHSGGIRFPPKERGFFLTGSGHVSLGK